LKVSHIYAKVSLNFFDYRNIVEILWIEMGSKALQEERSAGRKKILSWILFPFVVLILMIKFFYRFLFYGFLAFN
jgi:hypothetical protein